MRSIRRLITDDSGQDLAEYAMALAVITIGVAAIVVALGTNVESIWSVSEPKLNTVINAE